MDTKRVDIIVERFKEMALDFKAERVFSEVVNLLQSMKAEITLQKNQISALKTMTVKQAEALTEWEWRYRRLENEIRSGDRVAK